METVTQAKIKRPIVAQHRPRFRLDRDARLSLAMDAPGEPVRPLPAHRTEDRRRADDRIAAAIERDRAGALDITLDVAIRADTEHKHAAVNALDALVESCKPPRHIALDIAGQHGNAEFNGR